jgi:hypothetical protein
MSHRLCFPAALVGCALLFAATAYAGNGPDEQSFKVESNLRAAVAKIDISPPDGTRATGHVRDTKGFRDRLHAVVLLSRPEGHASRR